MSASTINPATRMDARWPKLPASLFRPIDPPPRFAAAGSVIVLLAVAVLSLAVTGAMGKWALAVLIVLMPLAVFFKNIYAVHMTLFALAWLLLGVFEPPFPFWPLSKLVPLAGYGLAVILIPPLRHSVGWLRTGRFAPDVRRLVVIVMFVSGAALVVWVNLAQPDLDHHLASIPDMPLWVYPLAALGFAVCNAAMEEVAFRGIMMEALESAVGQGFWSNGVQSVSFAAFHYLAGFPNGLSGFLMVSAYGLMLGALRSRAQGLLAPWAAHIAADLVIFAILGPVHLQQGGIAAA